MGVAHEVYGDPSPIEISVSAQTLQFNWGFSCSKPVYYDPGGSEKRISASDFHFGFFTIEILRKTTRISMVKKTKWKSDTDIFSSEPLGS